MKYLGIIVVLFSMFAFKSDSFQITVIAHKEMLSFLPYQVGFKGEPSLSGHFIKMKGVYKRKPTISSHPRYKKLLKEFHITLNGELKLADFTYASGQKVWWKCCVADDHEWEDTICNRTIAKYECPFCRGRQVALSNCLITTHPEIARQWHPTKNLSLTPFDVTFGSNKKVWWKCAVADDHEWQAKVLNRTTGNGCPCCSGHKLVLSNCLAIINPNLAKQWHPTKNLLLTPFDVTVGNGKKVWWKCDIAPDHEWKAKISNRVSKGTGCGCCYGRKTVASNSLATLYPEISKQWHPTKNSTLTPFDVTTGSNRKVWWKCDVADDHEWITAIAHRINGNNCPYCDGKKVALSNCLKTTNPDLANQWHPTKNIITPYDVTFGSSKRVWWRCNVSKDHEWESTIANRIKSGCPCCSGDKAVTSNCLFTTHPKVAREWHPTKNIITPYDVTFGSNKRVWWKCSISNSHEWEAPISRRACAEQGCPFCSESLGEKRVETILKLMNISYEIQKKFNNCRYKYKLSFDFYLPQYNVLIEYDGKQHFEPIKYFGGLKSLKTIQKRDKIKNKFVVNNNMPLLRIPYTKFESIEKEIISFISSLNNI